MSNHLQNEYKPDFVTPPGETLQQTIDALGMTKTELAGRIDRTSKNIIDIIKHGAPITPDTAMALEKALGVPASFWNNRERRYREALAKQEERQRLEGQVEWLKSLPVRPLINAGWIREYKDKVEQVAELLRFYGVSSPSQWVKIWMAPEAAYRKSKAFSSKPEACSAWLRKGELEAREIICEPYNEKGFRSVLKEIRSLTRTAPDKFQKEAVRLCAQFGVAVVFIPPIKGASVYGVTRWLSPQKALIQLSLRGKVEDLLWFTFFHEAGHILMHGKKKVFIESRANKDQQEKEADIFAVEFLIPLSYWEGFISTGHHNSHASVIAFAERIGVSPAIVVGRLQHEKLIPHNYLNKLRRRFEFAA
jgi:HTH-type transcriptional regulator / antitoxin HigA